MAGKTNGFDPSVVKGFVDRMVNLHDDEKGEHLAVSNKFKSDRTLVLDEAKDAGLPKKLLRAKVKEVILQRQADAVRDNLEGDDQDLYDQISIALGDYAATPLGEAALAAAE